MSGFEQIFEIRYDDNGYQIIKISNTKRWQCWNHNKLINIHIKHGISSPLDIQIKIYVAGFISAQLTRDASSIWIQRCW